MVWNSNSVQFSSSEVERKISRSCDNKILSSTGLSLQGLQKLPQIVGTENCTRSLVRKVCKDVFSRLTGLFCGFWWNDLHAVFSLLPLSICFLKFCLPTFFAAVLNFLLPINNLCKFWSSKIQQDSTHVFCRDDVFTQKVNCGSSNNLCKCNETPTTLLTITSIEWEPYSSWSNNLVTSLRLEFKVGGFSEHQKKTSDTDSYKVYFFTTRFPQTNVNTMKRVFEHRSEMQVAKGLIVHVLSSNYIVSSLEPWNGQKATHQEVLLVTNDIVLDQVLVYLERVYVDNIVRDLGFVRSFSSQHYSKFITIITSENVSQIGTEKCKIRSSFAR